MSRSRLSFATSSDAPGALELDDRVAALLVLFADHVELVGLAQFATGFDAAIGERRERRAEGVDAQLIAGLHRDLEIGCDAVLHVYARRLRAAADFFFLRTLGFS